MKLAVLTATPPQKLDLVTVRCTHCTAHKPAAAHVGEAAHVGDRARYCVTARSDPGISVTLGYTCRLFRGMESDLITQT